jgi:hypothetical protein
METSIAGLMMAPLGFLFFATCHFDVSDFFPRDFFATRFFCLDFFSRADDSFHPLGCQPSLALLKQVVPITSPSAWLEAPLPIEALATLASSSSTFSSSSKASSSSSSSSLSSSSSFSTAALAAALTPLGPRLRVARLTPALWAAVAEFLPLRDGVTTLACLAREFHTLPSSSSSTDATASSLSSSTAFTPASVPFLLTHRRAVELCGFADAERLSACLRHLAAHCPLLTSIALVDCAGARDMHIHAIGAMRTANSSGSSSNDKGDANSGGKGGNNNHESSGNSSSIDSIRVEQCAAVGDGGLVPVLAAQARVFTCFKK